MEAFDFTHKVGAFLCILTYSYAVQFIDVPI